MIPDGPTRLQAAPGVPAKSPIIKNPQQSVATRPANSVIITAPTLLVNAPSGREQISMVFC
jgi:hypothetical protein